jgi:crossover junction endodeoxyribonuclease RusA
MSSLTFVAYGRPSPQGSKRHVGRGVLVESSVHVKPWRQDVKQAAIACTPDHWDRTLAMTVSIVCRFKRPKGHLGKRGVKPSAPSYPASRSVGDTDKLARAILDGMTGICYDDDSQVISLSIQKRYCTADEPQGAVITVTSLSPAD